MSDRALGDFQTPPELVDLVLRACARDHPIAWSRVLEPTCGRGSFIRGVVNAPHPPGEIHGLELQDAYVREARQIQPPNGCTITIQHHNIFAAELRSALAWRTTGPLLVVGNPPWVTNAELGALGSANLPAKQNLKGAPGLEAMTGAGNFDIAESILLKVIGELQSERPTIAFLCKAAVARNVLQYCARAGWPIAHATIRRIDATRWFGASVDACLFSARVGTGLGTGLGTGVASCDADVYDTLDATTPSSRVGVRHGRLIADLDAYDRTAFLDGRCPLAWRQGIKHDATAVMELTQCGAAAFRNGLDEAVDVEGDFVFPLLKSTDVFRGRLRPSRAMVVPQRRLGADTRSLETAAPRVWRYLNAHAAALNARKSSIYRSQPPFSVFGIGAYSFAPFKVAVSGLHKSPAFRLVAPSDGRPVVLDDTCYFLPFETPIEAALVTTLLRSPAAAAFLASITFADAKRPITKKVLERIDLRRLFNVLGLDAVEALARQTWDEAFAEDAPWPTVAAFQRAIDRFAWLGHLAD